MKELNDNELREATGGNWLTDAWNATCDWCSDNANTLAKVGCVVGGIALCATGIGVGAGLGLIVVESVGAAAVVSTGVGTVVGATVGTLAFNEPKEDK